MQSKLYLRWNFFWVLLLTIFVFGSAYAGKYDDKFKYQEVVEKNFSVKNGQVLIIDTDRGSVQIVGGSGNEVTVKVIKGANRVSKDRAEEMFDRFRLDFNQTRDGVEIYGEYSKPGFWRSSFWNRLKVIYEIEVPSTFDLDIVTSGGSVEVENVNGEIRLKTSGGSLRLDELTGDIQARTSGGSVTAKNITGDAYLKTSGGSIKVMDCVGSIQCKTSGGSITAEGMSGDLEAHTSGGGIRLIDISGQVNASTSGGSIKAELVGQPSGPVYLKTSGGSVTLYMDEDVKVDIDARTSGGRGRVDFPVKVRGKISRSRLRGELNGGGPLLTLRSSGGGIKLVRR